MYYILFFVVSNESQLELDKVQRLIYWKDTEISLKMKIANTGWLHPESMGTKSEDSPVASFLFLFFFWMLTLLLQAFSLVKERGDSDFGITPLERKGDFP